MTKINWSFSDRSGRGVPFVLSVNSDMMAIGRPGPDEIALLEPFRGKIADEAFGELFVPPVSDGSGQDRALLRKAVRRILRWVSCFAMTDVKLIPR